MWYFIKILFTSFDDHLCCFVHYSYIILIPTSIEFFWYIWHPKLKSKYKKNVNVRKINTEQVTHLSHNKAQQIFNKQCYCYCTCTTQCHQSDKHPPFSVRILTSRTHSVGRADDTGSDCSHSSSRPSRRLAPTGNKLECHKCVQGVNC